VHTIICAHRIGSITYIRRKCESGENEMCTL
jgi:hypothetical protein